MCACVCVCVCEIQTNSVEGLSQFLKVFSGDLCDVLHSDASCVVHLDHTRIQNKQKYKHTHAKMQAYKHAYMHISRQTDTHTHTSTHKHTHVHINVALRIVYSHCELFLTADYEEGGTEVNVDDAAGWVIE